MAPSLVQPVVANSATGNTVTVTLGSPTTAGNCLIVLIGDTGSSTDGTPSTVTLGGVADNFAALATQGTGSSHAIVAAWADPDCAGGQTSVVVTTTGGSGTEHLFAWVFEFSGLATSSLLDQSATFNSSGFVSSWSIGPTATTTQASEVWFGVICGNASSGSATFAGPSSPWINATEQNISAAQALCGYQIVSATGTATYSGTASPTSTGEGLVVTVNAAPPSAPSPMAQNALPGQTWQRAFQHRQQPATLWLPNGSAPAAVAATGVLNATGAKNATGSSAIAATGLLADTGVKNATNSGDVSGTGTLADTGTHAGTGTGTVTDTGTVAPSGSGGDTPVLPLRAQAGQTWRRQFQHPQQVLPQPANAAAAATVAGTGSLNDTGVKAATGSSAISGTGSCTGVGVKNASSAGAVTATGSVAGAGSGGDTPVLPLRAQPGQTWTRQFQHRQQPVVFTQPSVSSPSAISGTGALASSGAKAATGSSAISGTGVLAGSGAKNAAAAATVTATGSLAAAGTHAATDASAISATGTLTDTGSHAGKGTSLVTAAGVIIANPPAPVPVIPPGTVTITPAGPNAATVAITAADPNSATVTIAQY